MTAEMTEKYFGEKLSDEDKEEKEDKKKVKEETIIYPTVKPHCFDIDDHPGSRYGAEVQPLSPSVDFNSKDGVPLELANLAIKEYNEKDSNVHKYKVLKVEKVNHSSCFETFNYWMTVKVLNLTLVTPIETFHIHAGLRVGFGEKIIYCCQPKKEVNVGLPCCDVCFGKLDG